MIKEIIATGKDVAEAQANARQLLGASELDDVNFEIIYLGRKGFMGFGAKPAQVRAYIELPDKEERRRRPERKQRNDRRPEAKVNAEATEGTAESTAASTTDNNAAEGETTEAKADADDATDENGGCGSFVGFGAVAMIAVTAVAGVVSFKKKED